MNQRLTVLVVWILLIVNLVSAQDFKTITYYEDDILKLEMDVFTPNKKDVEKSTLFIFMHGGGFSSGNRVSGHDLCKHLADKGIVAATITYTLYMKDKSFSCDGVLHEKVKAIQYGANHLWLATAYFIEHAEEYSIDTSKIFAAGTSAGGEAVLHAAFWDYKTMNMYDKKLPENFKYAGIISGAGAIMDINLIQSDNLVPVFMHHGNCDKLVPYATAAHHYCETNATGWLMFFGSYTIYNRIVELGGTAELMTFCGAGHEKAGLMRREFKDIVPFITSINNGEKFQSHIIVPTNKTCEASEKYIFCK